MNGEAKVGRRRLLVGVSVGGIVLGIALVLIAWLTWNTFQCDPGETGVLGVGSDGSVSSTCDRKVDSPLLLWLGVGSLLIGAGFAAAAARAGSPLS